MARGDYKCIYQIWKVININLHREMYIKNLNLDVLKCAHVAIYRTYSHMKKI